MHGHAVILRWTTALLALVELLDQQVMLGSCIFDTPTMLIVTSEVISATLSLPDQIFCPSYSGRPGDYMKMYNAPMESLKNGPLRSLGACVWLPWEFSPQAHQWLGTQQW